MNFIFTGVIVIVVLSIIVGIIYYSTNEKEQRYLKGKVHDSAFSSGFSVGGIIGVALAVIFVILCLLFTAISRK